MVPSRLLAARILSLGEYTNPRLAMLNSWRKRDVPRRATAPAGSASPYTSLPAGAGWTTGPNCRTASSRGAGGDPGCGTEQTATPTTAVVNTVKPVSTSLLTVILSAPFASAAA